MNKIGRAIAGLTAVIISQIATPDFSYAQPDSSAQSAEYPDETGVPSKLLGCMVSSDDKDFLERGYQQVRKKIKDTNGLKDAYCTFARGISKFTDTEAIRTAISLAQQIGSDKHDPMVGVMHILLGQHLLEEAGKMRLLLDSWPNVYAKAGSAEEARLHLRFEDQHKVKAKAMTTRGIAHTEKGLAYLMSHGKPTEELRNITESAYKDLIDSGQVDKKRLPLYQKNMKELQKGKTPSAIIDPLTVITPSTGLPPLVDTSEDVPISASKLLGCEVPRVQKRLLEKRYKKAGVQHPDLKKAYCSFAEALTYEDKQAFELAIAAMESAQAEQVDPMAGIIHIYFGQALAEQNIPFPYNPVSWDKAYEALKKQGESEVQTKMRLVNEHEAKKAAQKERALQEFEKGVAYLVKKGIPTKTFEDIARAACEEILWEYRNQPERRVQCETLMQR